MILAASSWLIFCNLSYKIDLDYIILEQAEKSETCTYRAILPMQVCK